MSVLAGEFDGIVANLGNHYGFHGAALPLMWSVPSLVILHDAWMRHFLQGWRHAAGPDIPIVDRMLGALGERQDPTGLGPLCSLAAGAVVHGPHYLDAARAACPGPVFEIPLAYAIPDLPPPRRLADRLVIATIGHINENKCADEVLRAIGASPRLRQRTSYFLIGPVEPHVQARLIEVARRVGAPEPHFTGWVPDMMLHALMAGLDAICCLRHPVMEGGSASLVSAMLSARPTLVSDQGVYGALPEGLVMKCRPGAEAAHVMNHLESILDAPVAAQAMGKRARAYALGVNAPRAYAAALVSALEASIRVAPSIRTGRAIGSCLAEFGAAPDDPAAARAAASLTELLNHTGVDQS
jgi:hypothetical protein